jgi:hypothetical protein
MFILAINAVFEELFGLPLQHRSRATPLMRNRTRGIFGTPVAAFGVVEEQARLTLHGHWLLWGGISPRLLQAVAGDEDTLATVGGALRAAIDSVFSAAVHPDVHVADLARRALKDVLPARAAYFTGSEGPPPPPPPCAAAAAVAAAATAEGQDAPPPDGCNVCPICCGCRGPHSRASPFGPFQIRPQVTALTVGLHKCECTCHKPPSGTYGCRGGMPAGHPVWRTGVVRLEPIVKEKDAKEAEGGAAEVDFVGDPDAAPESASDGSDEEEEEEESEEEEEVGGGPPPASSSAGAPTAGAWEDEEGWEGRGTPNEAVAAAPDAGRPPSPQPSQPEPPLPPPPETPALPGSDEDGAEGEAEEPGPVAAAEPPPWFVCPQHTDPACLAAMEVFPEESIGRAPVQSTRHRDMGLFPIPERDKRCLAFEVERPCVSVPAAVPALELFYAAAEGIEVPSSSTLGVAMKNPGPAVVSLRVTEALMALTDKAIVALAVEILKAPGVSRVLAEPSAMPAAILAWRTDIDNLTAVEAKRFLCDIVAELPCRNGRVVQYNDVLTAALGCNTAVLLLGGMEQARVLCESAACCHPFLRPRARCL